MRSMLGTVLAMSGIAIASGTAAAAEPVNLRFATVGVGSAWYNYGAGIANMVEPKLPEGSSIEVLPIAGGVGNMTLLQNGEAELAIAFPMPAADACKGKGVFDQVHDQIRGLVGGLDIYYFGAFVTEDSGITSWDDFVSGDKEVRLITTEVGGTGELAVRQVLGLYGTSYDDLEAMGSSVKALARSATAAAIADGNADMWAHTVTKGHPAATQLTTTNDMRMLSLSDEVIQGMVEQYGWVETTMPPNTFEGQTETIKTVKAPSNILIRADVPDEIAYTFTKTIMENAEKLPQIHAGLADFDPKLAADPQLLGGCPLHEGAKRYYQEAGIL